MTAFTIRIPDELNSELTAISKTEDRSKAYLAREAIKNYIHELKTNNEEAEIALARIQTDDRKFYTSKELIQKLEHNKQANN